MKPRAMLLRNLLAMDVEEAIRAHRIDGAVLPGGCDTAMPGQFMGAAPGELTPVRDKAERARRRPAWRPDPPPFARGYGKLYVDHVTQADTGADLDFRVGKDTRIPWRESN